MMSNQDNIELTYELAVAELEKIVSKLESGDVSLDDSMTLFQRGMQLSKFCSNKLQQMEEKITQLIAMPDNSVEEQPFSDIRDSENV